MIKKIITMITLLVLLGVIYWGSIYVYPYLRLMFADLTNADPNVKVAVIGVLVSVLLALYSNSRTKRREIASRHFTVKSQTYLKIINTLVTLLKEVKSGEETPQDELVNKLMEFKKELLVWGSPKLIASWNKYELLAADDPDYKNISIHMEMILREIRKDLGHSDWSLPHGSLWGLFLDAKSKKEVFS